MRGLVFEFDVEEDAGDVVLAEDSLLKGGQQAQTQRVEEGPAVSQETIK